MNVTSNRPLRNKADLEGMIVAYVKNRPACGEFERATVHWHEADAFGTNWSVDYATDGNLPEEVYLAHLNTAVLNLQRQYNLLVA
jgi:hypothetical protein